MFRKESHLPGRAQWGGGGAGGVGGLGGGVWSVPELEQQASVISRPIATIKRGLIMVRVFVGFVPFSNIG